MYCWRVILAKNWNKIRSWSMERSAWKQTENMLCGTLYVHNSWFTVTPLKNPTTVLLKSSCSKKNMIPCWFTECSAWEQTENMLCGTLFVNNSWFTVIPLKISLLYCWRVLLAKNWNKIRSWSIECSAWKQTENMLCGTLYVQSSWVTVIPLKIPLLYCASVLLAKKTTRFKAGLFHRIFPHVRQCEWLISQ